MTTRHKWNEGELEKLVELIEKHGVCNGAKKASEKIGVTISSAQSAYYMFKKREEKKAKAKAAERVAYNSVPTKRTKKEIMEETMNRDKMIAEFLSNAIAKNPKSLTRCFEITARAFDMSPGTIENKWYGKGQYKNCVVSRHNIGNVFATVGESCMVNGKNSECKPKRKTPKIVATILKLFRIEKQ